MRISFSFPSLCCHQEICSCHCLRRHQWLLSSSTWWWWWSWDETRVQKEWETRREMKGRKWRTNRQEVYEEKLNDDAWSTSSFPSILYNKLQNQNQEREWKRREREEREGRKSFTTRQEIVYYTRGESENIKIFLWNRRESHFLSSSLTPLTWLLREEREAAWNQRDVFSSIKKGRKKGKEQQHTHFKLLSFTVLPWFVS